MSAHPSLPPVPSAALRGRLLLRVQASRGHERQFTTVRRDVEPWQALADGVRVRPLATTDIASSSLVHLQPHAVLCTTGPYTLCETVLIEGSVLLGTQPLRAGDAALAPSDAAHPIRAGADGARFYLRRSLAETAATTLHFSTLDDTGWDDFCPGVRIRALWSGGERRSVLVRMRAGASVKAHRHALEEECMVLAGEAFIGDMLLRSGEYQLAPQGSEHGEVSTDVGALFFVHGALDPTAYA